MIRNDHLISILRFYNQENPSDYEDYCAVCTLTWESKDVIWINGLHGVLKPRHWYKLIEFLVKNNIKVIKATRSPNHKLPFVSKQNGTYCEILVQDLVDKYLNRRKTYAKSD